MVMICNIVGVIAKTKSCTTKDGRDYLEIELSCNNIAGERIYWRCHSYYPRHLNLIGMLADGRRILLYGELTRIYSYVSQKTGEIESKPDLRIQEIVFLDKPPSDQ